MDIIKKLPLICSPLNPNFMQKHFFSFVTPFSLCPRKKQVPVASVPLSSHQFSLSSLNITHTINFHYSLMLHLFHTFFSLWFFFLGSSSIVPFADLIVHRVEKHNFTVEIKGKCFFTLFLCINFFFVVYSEKVKNGNVDTKYRTKRRTFPNEFSNSTDCVWGDEKAAPTRQYKGTKRKNWWMWKLIALRERAKEDEKNHFHNRCLLLQQFCVLASNNNVHVIHTSDRGYGGVIGVWALWVPKEL